MKSSGSCDQRLVSNLPKSHSANNTVKYLSRYWLHVELERILRSLKILKRQDTRLESSRGRVRGLHSHYSVEFPWGERLTIHETLLPATRVLRVKHSPLGMLLLAVTRLAHRKEKNNSEFPFPPYPAIIFTQKNSRGEREIIAEWWSIKQMGSPMFQKHLGDLKIEFGKPILHEENDIFQFGILWEDVQNEAEKLAKRH